MTTIGGGGTNPRRSVVVPFGASGASLTVRTAILNSTLFLAPGNDAAVTVLSSKDVTLPTTIASAFTTRLGSGTASAAIVPALARSVRTIRVRHALAARINRLER